MDPAQSAHCVHCPAGCDIGAVVQIEVNLNSEVVHDNDSSDFWNSEWLTASPGIWFGVVLSDFITVSRCVL
jgi:hypothetical protein